MTQNYEHYLIVGWLPRFQQSGVRLIAIRLMVLLLLVRFAVPVIAIVNEGLYELFLKDHYETSLQQLEQTSVAIGNIQKSAAGPDGASEGTVLDRARRLLANARQSANFDARIERYKEVTANAITHTVNMIVIFVLQTILFPLFFLWLPLTAMESEAKAVSPR